MLSFQCDCDSCKYWCKYCRIHHYPASLKIGVDNPSPAHPIILKRQSKKLKLSSKEKEPSDG